MYVILGIFWVISSIFYIWTSLVHRALWFSVFQASVFGFWLYGLGFSVLIYFDLGISCDTDIYKLDNILFSLPSPHLPVGQTYRYPRSSYG
ncbi:hypothetical protein SAICODRAFT_80266, partial [Saitoella complicata NRRL Y-17804]|uniref:uncharacterized protein n=1 Tax=Saitoella complicata (strain BCRC 22490 / CBS 7301 / JCM 7358 / NBRC 10748 / NRRL Y-17804) TaxID=698492 RepID=UPI000867C266